MDTEYMAESVNGLMEEKRRSNIKFKIGQTVMVGIAFMTISMFWQVYDSLMPLFLKDFDFDKTVIGILMAMDNVFALVLLPFIGTLSDRFPAVWRKKLGRRIPFIVAGSVLSAVMFVLVNYSHNERALGAMLACTAFLLVFMCLCRTPAVALMPDITPKQVRSWGNVVINIMGLLGGVVSLVLMKILLKTEGTDEIFLVGDNRVLIFIISGLMVLCAAVMAFAVRENKLVEEKLRTLQELGVDDDCNESATKERVTARQAAAGLSSAQRRSLFFMLLAVALWYMAYNAVMTWFSSYAYEALAVDFTVPLLVANFAAFAMFVPSGMLGKKIGRKNTVLIGVVMMAVAFFAAIFIMATQNGTVIRYGIYPVLLFVGGGWATINVHSFVMSVELATEKTTGKFTGFYYTFAMAAQIFTPVLSGLFIDLLGYVALMPYAFGFMLSAFVSMTFVKHGNAKDKPIASAEGKRSI